jgi:hypothetical protein
MEISTQTVYFAKGGPENTERTLALAYERAKALGITTMLVATTSGKTALYAAELCQEIKVIAVTHSTGFREPDRQELTPDNRAAIELAGAQILTCQHALGGVNRAVRKKWGTYQLDEIIAYTLRILGQGVKVVAEISLMAADAGLVRTDEPVMAVGGSGRGADTAAVVLPTNAQTFFDLQIPEIVCRPAPKHPGL